MTETEFEVGAVEVRMVEVGTVEVAGGFGGVNLILSRLLNISVVSPGW